MLVYQDKPIQLFDKKDGVMYELRVLHKDGEPYIDLTNCIYGIPIKKLTVEEYETYDFNQ